MTLENLIEHVRKLSDMRIKTITNDYNAGVRDCRIGFYDKWYRYHRLDQGEAYDIGWQTQNKETQNETVTFSQA